MRFNPPPNWPPAPPGWTPPPGWQPDASWPPVPPGWQLWVDDSSRRKTGLIIGALATTLLIAGCVVVAIVATRPTSDVAVSKPTTTAVEEKTDEEQIEAVVGRFQDAWNELDFAAFEPIVCQDIRREEEFNETDFLAARQDGEDMDVTVTSVDVDVDGQSATANLEPAPGTSRGVAFVREDGDWKWCE
jgi:hypothetical protein